MFAALHLPDLSIAAALLEKPNLHDGPCAILRESKGRDDAKIPLLATNDAARFAGISADWPLNRALVRCPDLTLLTRHEENESTLLAELVDLADRLTPDVEITSPDTVLLDLSARRLPPLLEALEALPLSGVEVCHALADTPDLAYFAVLDSQTRARFISPDEMAILPVSLLGKLDGDATFLPMLELLGIHTLGDFRRLPRQELVARFGALAGYWQDVVAGKSCRLLKLHRPPESLAQAMDLDDAIESSEALVFLFKRLLQVLCGRLAARHLAVSVLMIDLRLENGDMRREIRLPEPLAHPAALLMPLQVWAESLVLPSPVCGITLDVATAFPLSRQSEWTRRELPRPECWADTLARLDVLLGGGRVGIGMPLPSHRADAFEMQKSSMPPGSSPLLGTPICSIPLRRFRPPLKIAVAFETLEDHYPQPLALLTGPHPGEVLDRRGPFSVSGDAWEPTNAWQRLEWDVQVEHAPLLRLVFQPENHWQIEGIYC